MGSCNGVSALGERGGAGDGAAGVFLLDVRSARGDGADVEADVEATG